MTKTTGPNLPFYTLCGSCRAWPCACRKENRPAPPPKGRLAGGYGWMDEYTGGEVDDEGADPRPPYDSFLQFPDDAFSRELKALYDLHAAKRADYTGGGHLLANYKFSADMVGLSLERAMFGRMAEKFYRIRSLYANKDKGLVEQNETMEDSDRDIAIIAILRILSRREGSGYDG